MPVPVAARSLRRRSAAARLLRSWVRIPPGAWMFVCCECRVLSGRGLCDEPITRPEESYRLWCVAMCDLETSRIRRPWPAVGRSATWKKIIYIYIYIYIYTHNLSPRIYTHRTTNIHFNEGLYCGGDSCRSSADICRLLQFLTANEDYCRLVLAAV